MPAIRPKNKNCRFCENCNAGYVINGDESEYWCQAPGIIDDFPLDSKKEGVCNFCKKGIIKNNPKII